VSRRKNTFDGTTLRGEIARARLKWRAHRLGMAEEAGKLETTAATVLAYAIEGDAYHAREILHHLPELEEEARRIIALQTTLAVERAYDAGVDLPEAIEDKRASRMADRIVNGLKAERETMRAASAKQEAENKALRAEIDRLRGKTPKQSALRVVRGPNVVPIGGGADAPAAE